MVTLTDEQAELIWGFLKSVEKHPVGQELTYRTIEVDGKKEEISYMVSDLLEFLEPDPDSIPDLPG